MRYLCEKDDVIASGNKESVIPRSLMERLMMKNSAGFKVDRLWYATSSRMQLPMRDSIPVRKHNKDRLSWAGDGVPIRIRHPRVDQHSSDWLVVRTHKTRCTGCPWGCRAPWRWRRQTQQMCLKHFPSEMLTRAHTHRLIVNYAVIKDVYKTRWKQSKWSQCLISRAKDMSSLPAETKYACPQFCDLFI